MQTILILIISCFVFGEISKCSASTLHQSGPSSSTASTDADRQTSHTHQLGSQVLKNLSNLVAAIQNAAPAIREYRDDIVYRSVDHKLKKPDFIDLLVTVRYVWRTGSRNTIVLMKQPKDQLKKKMDLTNWLGYCITLLRAINTLIGTDGSIFKEGVMDTNKFVADIDSFSEDFKGVRERITSEAGRESETFADPAVGEIQEKLDEIYGKYTEFLKLNFFA